MAMPAAARDAIESGNYMAHLQAENDALRDVLLTLLGASTAAANCSKTYEDAFGEAERLISNDPKRNHGF